MFNPIALRKAKIVYNFGLSECHRIKDAASALFLVLESCVSYWMSPAKTFRVCSKWPLDELFHHQCCHNVGTPSFVDY